MRKRNLLFIFSAVYNTNCKDKTVTNKTELEQVREAEELLEAMVSDIEFMHETGIKEVFNNMPVERMLATLRCTLKEKAERLENNTPEGGE